MISGLVVLNPRKIKKAYGKVWGNSCNNAQGKGDRKLKISVTNATKIISDFTSINESISTLEQLITIPVLLLSYLMDCTSGQRKSDDLFP